MSQGLKINFGIVDGKKNESPFCFPLHNLMSVAYSTILCAWKPAHWYVKKWQCMSLVSLSWHSWASLVIEPLYFMPFMSRSTYTFLLEAGNKSRNHGYLSDVRVHCNSFTLTTVTSDNFHFFPLFHFSSEVLCFYFNLLNSCSHMEAVKECWCPSYIAILDF